MGPSTCPVTGNPIACWYLVTALAIVSSYRLGFAGAMGTAALNPGYWAWISALGKYPYCLRNPYKA
ncbi:hypothetical protein Acor_08790 [Acrocarpospora corrugata]|uniref:Uncharacterized protein n=1 Tax=Acrocarpospora corrugata TaxID=35763 RepID=A0A5M3VQA7_9ACTN|nr:hypothetical protein Acor_08790 [Acrocarpospora corrugata]